MSYSQKLLFILVVLVLGGTYGATHAQILKSKVKGGIITTGTQKEVLWYVYPKDKKRYGARDSAFLFKMLIEFSKPISAKELQKIPLSFSHTALYGVDEDEDGVPSELELALFTNPLADDTDGDGYTDYEELHTGHNPFDNSKHIFIDMKKAKEYSGSVLRSETQGQDAYWYVHPEDGKRYFLSSPEVAYTILGDLSKMMNQNDLRKIPEGVFPRQIVKSVIDGDTIELESGRLVRYIGIDAPEIAFDDCFGREATEMNRALVEGREVLLSSDRSFTDEEGRLLLYVRSNDLFVNDILVRDGYAFASAYAPDVKYSRDFFHAQREAKEARRGLWGNCWHPEAKQINN